MAYGQTTVYDMADPRTVAESEDGIIYRTAQAQIANGAAIRRNALLSINDGVAAEITNTESAGESSQTKKVTVSYDSTAEAYTVSAINEVTVSDVGANAAAAVTGVRIVRGLTLLDGDEFAASAFSENKLTVNFDYTGKSYVTAAALSDGSHEITIEAEDASDLPLDFMSWDGHFIEDRDYTYTLSISEQDGKDGLTLEVNAVSESYLSKYLALGRSIEVEFILDISYAAYPDDYTVSYTDGLQGIDTTVTLEQAVSADVIVDYKKNTSSGKLAAMAIYDTATTDSRTIAVYTAGQFKKALIPNYSPTAIAEGFDFV